MGPRVLHGTLTTESQKRLAEAVYGAVEDVCTWKKAGAGGAVKPGLFFAGMGLVDLAKLITEAVTTEVDEIVDEAIENERNRPPF